MKKTLIIDDEKNGREALKSILETFSNDIVISGKHGLPVTCCLRIAFSCSNIIIKACAQRDCILELNAQPDRLDLNDIHCKMAKEAGVKIAISTDAHSVKDFDLMAYGIGQARRGWLEKEDVVNTKSLEKLMGILKR